MQFEITVAVVVAAAQVRVEFLQQLPRWLCRNPAALPGQTLHPAPAVLHWAAAAAAIPPFQQPGSQNKLPLPQWWAG